MSTEAASAAVELEAAQSKTLIALSNLERRLFECDDNYEEEEEKEIAEYNNSSEDLLLFKSRLNIRPSMELLKLFVKTFIINESSREFIPNEFYKSGDGDTTFGWYVERASKETIAVVIVSNTVDEPFFRYRAEIDTDERRPLEIVLPDPDIPLPSIDIFKIAFDCLECNIGYSYAADNEELKYLADNITVQDISEDIGYNLLKDDVEQFKLAYTVLERFAKSHKCFDRITKASIAWSAKECFNWLYTHNISRCFVFGRGLTDRNIEDLLSKCSNLPMFRLCEEIIAKQEIQIDYWHLTCSAIKNHNTELFGYALNKYREDCIAFQFFPNLNREKRELKYIAHGWLYYNMIDDIESLLG